MPKEREHKFIFMPKDFPAWNDTPYEDRHHYPLLFGSQKKIVQGYLSTKPTVRIRIVNNLYAYLTVKGSGRLERDEFEYPVPLKDGLEMLAMCGEYVIKKTRYEIDGWEIDVFEGRHKGLFLAEYELNDNHKLPKKLPEWVGKEVTDNIEYSNANLAKYGLKKIKLKS